MESLNVSVTREEVERFLSVKKFYGYGYGKSNGSCSQDSYGYGSGYGSGNGSGNCDESGEGSGVSVMNIKTFKGYIVDYIDGVPTIITNIHNNVAIGFIIGFDMTLIPCYVAKAGNYFAHGKTLKDAVKDAEAKEMGEMPIEERIEKFIEVFGSMDSEHMGEEFYDWHHILTGSCRMGRDQFCKENGIDLTKKYSVRYFLNITKNSYGGEVIKQISKELTKE